LQQASIWTRPPGASANGLRIGLLGGSFNPAHDGHLHVSLSALKALELDYVWWLISPQNPLKHARDMAGLNTRLAAARLKARHPRILVAAIEVELGTRYTVDTLRRLKARFPTLRFVWLMGSDNLLQIPRWRNWREIFHLVPVATVTRPGTALRARFGSAVQVFAKARKPPSKTFPAQTTPAWTLIEARHHPQSATLLRAQGLKPSL
jgi:nicotinate-nucleotide adenylyltransferase